MDGEKFLDMISKDLYKSEEVKHASNSKSNKYEAINDYLKRLEKSFELATTEHKKNILKSFYHQKYVIKEENIPRGLSRQKMQEIIQGQKNSLDRWIDCLSDKNNKAPMWVKYWAFQGMLKIGNEDEANGIYTRRTKSTIAPFIEPNEEAINKCMDYIIRYIDKENIEDQQIKSLLTSGNFSKLYTMFIKQFKENVYKSSAEGIWIKYNYETEEEVKNKINMNELPEYEKLYNSLQGYNTGWCTAGSILTAKEQICGEEGYKGGDFYVYYTNDENLKPCVPRIAIRMDGHDKIREIRGVAESQNLEEGLEDVLEQKLKSFSFISNEEIEKNLKTIANLRELTKLSKKDILSDDEMRFIFINSKIGFGWQVDPRVEKLRNKHKITSKKFMLEAQTLYKTSLKYASEELKNDKEVVLEAVKEDRYALEYASEELKNDKEIILGAVKQNKYALKYASEELKNDKEFMLEAVKQNGDAFEYASEELKNDKEIILGAVKQNKYALAHASEELKNDKEFMLEAVKQNASILYFASKELHNDKEVMLEAVKQNGDALKYASKELKNNKEVVLEAVRKAGFALAYASEELKNDKEVVLEAVKQDSYLLIYASKELKNDKEVVLEAVRQFYDFLLHILEEYDIEEYDIEEVLDAMEEAMDTPIKYASEELKNDKSFWLEKEKIKLDKIKSFDNKESLDESFKNTI